MTEISKKSSDLRALCGVLFKEIVREDKQFLFVGIVYGIIISLLMLAVPVSVQLLVTSVANTASLKAVVTLTIVLSLLLLFAASLIAMQSYVMERFERRFYARITTEFTMRLLKADRKHFKSVNRYELVNRYFDVTQVQKILPALVVGLFATLLQTIVGCVVVATFHTALLVFVIMFVLLLWLGWRLWGYHAMHSAIILSEEKYRTARHLEDVARASDYYKSSQHGQYAMDESDKLTGNYIKARETHFRHVFSQQIWLLLLYVIANSGLLGLGGSLVISGELGLGQLIAAELILSGVFYGISRIAYSLAGLYSLVAALEEIYRVIDIPTEEVSGKLTLDNTKPAGMTFDNVRVKSLHDNNLNLHFTVNPADKLLIRSESYELQAIFFDIIKRYDTICAGKVLIGDINIEDLRQHPLRDRIIILDRPTIIETTVQQYLTIDAPHASYTEIRDVLDMVELTQEIDRLPQKELTALSIEGPPLTVSETLRLKLAAALLAKPHILVLNEFFDIISGSRRDRIMSRLCAIPELTLLYFSQQLNTGSFDRFMIMDDDGQREVPSIAALQRFQDTTRGGSA